MTAPNTPSFPSSLLAAYNQGRYISFTSGALGIPARAGQRRPCARPCRRRSTRCWRRRTWRARSGRRCGSRRPRARGSRPDKGVRRGFIDQV
eukprot:1190265-Prorocentrum_minimum.AAC.7